jgi:hypothetical protein
MCSEAASLEIRAEDVIFMRAYEDPGSGSSELLLLRFCKVHLYHTGYQT